MTLFVVSSWFFVIFVFQTREGMPVPQIETGRVIDFVLARCSPEGGRHRSFTADNADWRRWHRRDETWAVRPRGIEEFALGLGAASDSVSVADTDKDADTGTVSEPSFPAFWSACGVPEGRRWTRDPYRNVTDGHERRPPPQRRTIHDVSPSKNAAGPKAGGAGS